MSDYTLQLIYPDRKQRQVQADSRTELIGYLLPHDDASFVAAGPYEAVPLMGEGAPKIEYVFPGEELQLFDNLADLHQSLNQAVSNNPDWAQEVKSLLEGVSTKGGAQ
jgi:hypothetical protein